MHTICGEIGRAGAKLALNPGWVSLYYRASPPCQISLRYRTGPVTTPACRTLEIHQVWCDFRAEFCGHIGRAGAKFSALPLRKEAWSAPPPPHRLGPVYQAHGLVYYNMYVVFANVTQAGVCDNILSTRPCGHMGVGEFSHFQLPKRTPLRIKISSINGYQT